MEGANALRHRDLRLRITEGLGAPGFIEWNSGEVAGVRAGAPLQRVLMIFGAPGSGQIDLRQRREAQAEDNNRSKNDLIESHHGFSPYHREEHGAGFHPASLACFLKWEVMMNGSRRYCGSVVTIVTIRI